MTRLSEAVIAVLIGVSLTACGSAGGHASGTSDSTSNGGFAAVQSSIDTEAEETESSGTSASASDEAGSGETESIDTNGKMLVAYFSATGTTRGVAEKIASVTGGNLYEIVPVQPYTDEDLDYSNGKSRTTVEQNDKSVRPEVSGAVDNWDSYSTVYLGYPIWWGEEPRILNTFVESYSFDGRTVIPFCTSGGSGIGQSGKNLESEAASGTWLLGERFSGSTSEEDIQSWISSLNFE